MRNLKYISKNGLQEEFKDFVQKYVFKGGMSSNLSDIKAIILAFMNNPEKDQDINEILVQKFKTTEEIYKHIVESLNNDNTSDITDALANGFRDIIIEAIQGSFVQGILIDGGIHPDYITNKLSNIQKIITRTNIKVLFESRQYELSPANKSTLLSMVKFVRNNVLDALIQGQGISQLSSLLKLHETGCIHDEPVFNKFLQDPSHIKQLNGINENDKVEYIINKLEDKDKYIY